MSKEMAIEALENTKEIYSKIEFMIWHTSK